MESFKLKKIMKIILLFTLFFFFSAPVKTDKKPSRAAKRQPLSFSKQGVLPKDYYKPKKTKQQLSLGLNQKVNNLQRACSAEANKKETLIEELKVLKAFLERNLQDPYMIYAARLEFGDFLSLMEEGWDEGIPLTNFALAYRRLYNLPEDIKPENYPHPWAKNVQTALKCVEES